MKFFPMFLRMEDRDVLIVGGGEQAAQKARLMLKTEARLTIMAGELDPELAALVEEGRARHLPLPDAPQALAGAALVFVCTEDPDRDAAIGAMARQAGALVNVVDRPELCEATTPSLVDRDPLVVAIGTEGAGPVLARTIKTRLEEMLEPNLGQMVALAGRLRGAVADNVPERGRRSLWRWYFLGAPRQAFARGAEREAASLLKAAIAAGGAPDTPAEGALTLIGAGPGARDLLTLRAVQRLQEADLICYPPGVDPDLLELARRDAHRLLLADDGTVWPQDRITAQLVAAVAEGGQVVRLHPGAGGAEMAQEAQALLAEGLAVEIVPGIAKG